MTHEENNLDTIDIYTIVTYRYLFDKKDDIVKLSDDIRDLHHFPERLMGSYCDEWQKYIGRAAKQRSIKLSHQNAQLLVQNMSSEQQNELHVLLAIVEQTLTIIASPNIKVIKTNLKSFVESLLNL